MGTGLSSESRNKAEGRAERGREISHFHTGEAAFSSQRVKMHAYLQMITDSRCVCALVTFTEITCQIARAVIVLGLSDSEVKARCIFPHAGTFMYKVM